MRADSPRLVVLEDDPTGTQLCAGVEVLMRWGIDDVKRALGDSAAPIHVSTNSRGVEAAEARRRVAEATRTFVSSGSECRFLLRGDSTLRGHVLAEFEGLREGVEHQDMRSMVLVPALPSAGRITVGGIVWLLSEARWIPVGESPYARDKTFGYISSSLLEWLEERSDGYWQSRDGIELPLSRLRAGGPEAVCKAIEAAVETGGACVPDAVEIQDLQVISEGVNLAISRGATFAIRCGPAFAAVAGKSLAGDSVPFPERGTGLLVIVGSYVPNSTRQLGRLEAEFADVMVELSVERVLSARSRCEEIASVSRRLGHWIEEKGIAIVATPRVTEASGVTVTKSAVIAEALAQIVSQTHPRPDVVLSKGGVTSAVTISDGIGASRASVIGPIAPGIGLWRTRWSDTGDQVEVVVFPGNVGEEDSLLRVTKGILGV